MFDLTVLNNSNLARTLGVLPCHPHLAVLLPRHSSGMGGGPSLRRSGALRPSLPMRVPNGPARPVAHSRRARLVLRVAEPEGERARTYDLPEEVTVGRAPGCGVRVDDAYTSSIHARVYRRDGTLWVEDLGSTNGTWLNGERLTSPAKVGRGDLVQVGGTVFEVAR